MNRPNRGANKGFTLLELMVVVAIIMILAGILMPAMVKIQQKSKIRKAQAEVKNLATAIRAYHTEYGEWPANPAAGGLWINNTNLVIGCLVGSGNPKKINFYEVNDTTVALCDPFRSNLPYRIEISVTSNYVKVYSFGPDCVAGVDDIEVEH